MASKYSVKIRTIVEELGLTPLHTSADYDTRILTVADVNRPALQLTGFYNYFDPKRLQIIGRVESTYLELKTADERRNCFEELMKLNIAALVICHNTVAFPECLEMAEKYDCNVFTTTEDTSDFMANVIVSLHTHLAPRTTVHGVLVEDDKGIRCVAEHEIRACHLPEIVESAGRGRLRLFLQKIFRHGGSGTACFLFLLPERQRTCSGRV